MPTASARSICLALRCSRVTSDCKRRSGGRRTLGRRRRSSTRARRPSARCKTCSDAVLSSRSSLGSETSRSRQW
eukprot:6192792-Pleurochrysis_carterae.AAC.2